MKFGDWELRDLQITENIVCKKYEKFNICETIPKFAMHYNILQK